MLRIKSTHSWSLMTNLIKPDDKQLVLEVCIWLSFEETNSLCFWLHHIWPLHIPALLRTVWRGDSCCWRFTPPLLKALPRQLNSEPLHRILDPGERSPEQKRRPALSSASPRGWVTISLINMNPGKHTDWQSISLAVCILLNNVWPPPDTKKVTRGFTSTFSCPAHSQPHPAGGSKPWEITLRRTERILN